jgi:hypothetical protein
MVTLTTRRRQRRSDVLLDHVAVFNDVNFLVVKLLDDGVHPAALRADTGADRVDLGVRGLTAIFVRLPASRAMLLISTTPSKISGTSSSNSA